jgi:hypothetical protein
MSRLIEHLSPAGDEVKAEATRTAESRQRAIRARREAERQLGISFKDADDIWRRR